MRNRPVYTKVSLLKHFSSFYIYINPYFCMPVGACLHLSGMVWLRERRQQDNKGLCRDAHTAPALENHAEWQHRKLLRVLTPGRCAFEPRDHPHWCVHTGVCIVVLCELVIQTAGRCAHKSMCVQPRLPQVSCTRVIRSLQVFAGVLCLLQQFVCCITDIGPEIIQSLPVNYA